MVFLIEVKLTFSVALSVCVYVYVFIITIATIKWKPIYFLSAK